MQYAGRLGLMKVKLAEGQLDMLADYSTGRTVTDRRTFVHTLCRYAGRQGQNKR